ncbi:MAG: hypothetical protein PHV49_06685 [Alistipes sp.]|nr:hypothetical protein [Alistipes sp.]
MSSGLLIFLITLGVVAFFFLGMSLTLIFKGHHIESEIGENPHMKERGIRCTSQQIRDEERALRGEDGSTTTCEQGSCSSCSAHACDTEKKSPPAESAPH